MAGGTTPDTDFERDAVALAKALMSSLKSSAQSSNTMGRP